MPASFARRSPLSVLVALSLPLLLSCGSESGPSAPDNYLPVISNFWRNVATPAHTLLMQSTDDRKPSGVFTGTETRPGSGSSPVSGSFSNSAATFVINRSSGAVTYTGKFFGGDSLRLTGSGESLTFRIQ